jgi:hypothetical protein
MGMECCYSATNLKKVPTNSLQWYIADGNVPSKMTAGFSSVSITKKAMIVTYYDQDGNVVYTAPAVNPRN